MHRGVVALLLAACVEAPPVASERRAIVAGEVDDGDSAVVALVGTDLCTATLISRQVALTAAHCMGPSTPEAIFVGTDVRVGGTTVAVVDRVTHPDWDPGTLYYDFGLMLLEEPAPVEPARLNVTPIEFEHVGAPVRIVGFGDVGPEAGERGVKRQATSLLDDFDAITIYYGGTAAQTCYGDSGGPAFMTLAGQEVLAGVTSYGDAACAVFGAAGRVDVVMNDFIRPYLEAHPDCGADGVCTFDCPEDPDCGGRGELETGDRCGDHVECRSSLCIGAVDDPAYRYCSEPCFSSAECDVARDVAMECTPTTDPEVSVCAWPDPSPGAVGWPCGGGDDCVYGVCVATVERGTICSKACLAEGGGDCPLGYRCEGEPAVCMPAGEGGGCRIGRKGNAVGLLLALCYILTRLHGQKAHRHPHRRR